MLLPHPLLEILLAVLSLLVEKTSKNLDNFGSIPERTTVGGYKDAVSDNMSGNPCPS